MMVNYFIQQLLQNSLLAIIGVIGIVIFLLLISKTLTWSEQLVVNHIHTPFWYNFFIYWQLIGVVAHEISHALVAKLFGAKILDIKLFQKPTRENGYRMGYVKSENFYGNSGEHLHANLGAGLSAVAPILLILPLIIFLLFSIINSSSYLIKIGNLLLISSLFWGLNLSPVDWHNVRLAILPLLILLICVIIMVTLIETIIYAL